VGPSWASEILFSARRLTAAEALHAGLVNRVIPAGNLRDEVWSLAGTIRDNAPLTVRSLKVAIREARRDPAKRDLERVASLVEECFRSEDYREGQAAFMAKRAPEFRGR
jgi:enoyl-CoA hydratase/carnithine racemase